MNVYTEKKTLKRIIVLMVSFALVFTSVFAFSGNSKVHAAAEGTMISNAVQIQWGTPNLKIWTAGSDHLNHYSMFSVPSRGNVNIKATKPSDDEGEYGTMYFTVYDEEGNIVWGNKCYDAVDGILPSYDLNVGLDAGTYIMTIKPGFTVQSGVIETTYTLNYTQDPYSEVEPNETQYTATPLTLGKVTTGYFGQDGFYDAEEYDYYKVSMQKGNTYKIAVGNFQKITPTTTLIYVITPDGEEDYIKLDLEKLTDANGRNFINYEPTETGTHYIQFDNYAGVQYKYDIVVSKIVKKTQTIKTGAKSYKKKVGAPNFDLKVKAKGDVTISSSNEDVVDVFSDGEVWVEGVGKATITIKAEATELYKAATKKVTVTVVPKTTHIKSIVNQKTKKMKLTWNMDYDVDGYQIQYATNQKFTKNKKTVKVGDKWADEKIINKLGKKTYYVRLRSYAKGPDGKTYYADWSKVKKIKIKK